MIHIKATDLFAEPSGETRDGVGEGGVSWRVIRPARTSGRNYTDIIVLRQPDTVDEPLTEVSPKRDLAASIRALDVMQPTAAHVVPQ